MHDPGGSGCEWFHVGLDSVLSNKRLERNPIYLPEAEGGKR
jgi:hypothetical protein